ncbi:MAG: TetR/AcrR family transcriptional regulator [Pseudomonadota bacterium]
MQGTAGRANQKLRTRKDLLKAGAALLKDGRTPSLDDVAEAALVSRATAYRYFPSIEALLAEAALDVATPDVADLLGPGAPSDPVARLEKVDAALHDMVLANEPALRLMLANALQRAARGEGASDTPLRQNRRTPLIEAALEPARRQLKPGSIEVLAKALALVVGTEAMVVLKDVLRVDDQEARKIKKWAIRALVDAARR